MNKVFVALMDNGSGESIMHGIHATQDSALEQLQRVFLEDYDDEDNEGDDGEPTLVDPKHPTLEEMEARTPGTCCAIVEVMLGESLYVECDGGFGN